MRHLLFVALLAAAAPALAAENGVTRAARPIHQLSPASVANAYPDEAIKRNEEGTTVYSIEIDERGQVVPSSCKIVTSSGSKLLDRATCSIAHKYFRFEPALKDGQPVRETATSRMSWTLPGSARHLRMTLADLPYFGVCVAKASPQIARQIAELPLGSEEQGKAVSSFDQEALGCQQFGSIFKIPPVYYAGVMAEPLYRNRPEHIDPNLPGPAPRNALEAFGKCLVRGNAAAVRELIMSDPKSPAESAAFAKLVPSIEPCITAGETVKLDKTFLRAVVAASLLREIGYPAAAAEDAEKLQKLH